MSDEVVRALDKNGIGYGWYCRSGNHLWIGKEDAEKCCDGIHERVLVSVCLRPYRAIYEWQKKVVVS
jgi:hypothetical protein